MSEELIKTLQGIALDLQGQGQYLNANRILAVACKLESRHAPAVQVPEGWALVPVEPTTESLMAMHSAYWGSDPSLHWHENSGPLWRKAYAAMLAPAPAVQVPDVSRFERLLDDYWNVAYAEGEEGCCVDKPDGRAQSLLTELRGMFRTAVENCQPLTGGNNSSAPATVATEAVAQVGQRYAPDDNAPLRSALSDVAVIDAINRGGTGETEPVAQGDIVREVSALEWMRRTSERLAVADRTAGLLEMSRGLTGWIERARASFDEHQDRALKAERERDVLMKAVAQGGGVDVEKVMALVEQYGQEKWNQGDNQYRRGCESSATYYSEEAGRIRDRLRALLASTAVPVGDGFISAGVVINNNQPGSQYIVEGPYGQTVCVGTEVFIK